MLDEPFNERPHGKIEREKLNVKKNGHDDCRMNVNFKGYQNHDLHKIIRWNNYSQKRHGTQAHSHRQNGVEYISHSIFFSLVRGRRVRCINFTAAIV